MTRFEELCADRCCDRGTRVFLPGPDGLVRSLESVREVCQFILSHLGLVSFDHLCGRAMVVRLVLVFKRDGFSGP